MAIDASDVVHAFAPNAKPAYAGAFDDSGGLLAAAGIVTPLRLAHFMAQCLFETGALRILVENGRYSAKNLADMWDAGNWHRYFADRAACVAMAEQCAIDDGAALFSLVYGNRMGNGAPATQDGWRFRGRGIMQTTGREAYRKYGNRCGVDFEGQPDLVVDARHALKPALMEWSDRHLNVAADHDDIKAITYGINGGYNGLAERRAWFARIWPFVIGAPPVERSVAWRVQETLARQGYDVGQPDGVVGPRTRLAIVAYRARNGLHGGPRIDADLSIALGI